MAEGEDKNVVMENGENQETTIAEKTKQMEKKIREEAKRIVSELTGFMKDEEIIEYLKSHGEKENSNRMDNINRAKAIVFGELDKKPIGEIKNEINEGKRKLLSFYNLERCQGKTDEELKEVLKKLGGEIKTGDNGVDIPVRNQIEDGLDAVIEKMPIEQVEERLENIKAGKDIWGDGIPKNQEQLLKKALKEKISNYVERIASYEEVERMYINNKGELQKDENGKKIPVTKKQLEELLHKSIDEESIEEAREDLKKYNKREESRQQEERPDWAKVEEKISPKAQKTLKKLEMLNQGLEDYPPNTLVGKQIAYRKLKKLVKMVERELAKGDGKTTLKQYKIYEKILKQETKLEKEDKKEIDAQEQEPEQEKIEAIENVAITKKSRGTFLQEYEASDLIYYASVVALLPIVIAKGIYNKLHNRKIHKNAVKKIKLDKKIDELQEKSNSLSNEDGRREFLDSIKVLDLGGEKTNAGGKNSENEHIASEKQQPSVPQNSTIQQSR